MANKKNNQNKKNTDGPTMNGNNTTVTASLIHNASQNPQHSTSPSPNAMHQNNNSAAVTNGTTTPTPSSTTTTTGSQHHQSQNQHSHQKPLTTSTSSQQANNSKQPVKKINSNVGSQSSHGGVGARGGGGVVKQDPKPKEKEKEKSFQASGRQSNQANHHHHHVHHNTGGGGCGNQQNHRKKENKNRDQSNQSHRGGGSFGNSHSHQHQSSHSAEIAKSTGFPSNSSLSSSGQTTNSAVQTIPPPSVTLEDKKVQTDEIVEKKVKVVIKEEPPHFKSTNPKDMDTVMAFKEHDDWNKVELLLELLSFLSPTDLRLLGNCIEGSVRCYTNQMRPVENTSNSPDPTACLPAFLCSLTPQQPSSFPDATSESSLVNQRSMVNNLFAHQHPPGLPPLIPAMIYPVETNYQQSTSSMAPSSTLPANTKDICNGTTPTSSTTSASNTPSEQQQHDSLQNVAKNINGSITTSNPPSSKPLSEAEALSPTSARTSSATTPQPEPPVPQEPEKFLRSVRDLTSYLYMLMAVCASTNRKSAAKISDYVKNVVIREKGQILERIPDELDKIDVLQDIGKIVAAMTHHPAVSVDDKMKYADMRDGLRAEIECLFRLYYSPEKELERKRAEVTSTQGVGDVADEGESDEEDVEEYEIERRYEYTNSRFGNNSQSSSGAFFITRFIGRQVEKSDNLFSLEIHWSDGDRTFAQRTSNQLKALQHRLLDEFGQQRSEKSHHGMASSISSFDEDHKKLSTSTSTMETSFAPPGDRIVPRLARDATPVQYIQYINELSDLPARMMLSTVICEEFNGTRLRTEDLLQETNETSDGLIFSRWKNPRAKSPVRYFQRNAAGKIEAIELPINLQPFIYSNIPQTQMQTLFPSCSNCGGPHMVKDCNKPTLLDKKVEHKMRLDPEGPVTMPPQIPGVTTPAVAYPPMHAQMPHPMYLDNNQLLGVGHFAHHQQQQQQMMQNAMFHNGQFRTNGQFENPGQLIFYQQVVPNSNNTNSNNGNGGASQNSNF
ncbi:CRE-GLS-1 protein [Caenorhabditis remanei]|uniref:CRE-GLS-1 protein n=1 Tax=Caenorhabditis remanei TaxID=31234 RepID=E3LVL0_CAERE|nr:CRE-GLS-1 protein [Caenorhabditis remanei]